MKTSLAAFLLLAALASAPPAHACTSSLEHCSPSSTVGGLGQPPTPNTLVADAGLRNVDDPSMPGLALAQADGLAATPEPVTTSTPVPAPTSIGDDVGLLPTIAKDFAAGGPGTLLAVGLALLVIVQLLKQYGGSLGIPAAYLPWLAIALGVLAGAGLSLASGAPLVPSLASGLVAGLASVGKYEAIGSKLLPSASDVAAKPAGG